MAQFISSTGKFLGVRGRIETHRRLVRVKNRFVRQIGAVLATGLLDKRLTQLSDRQIGQLMFDEVGDDLPVFQPETVILEQATVRLFRSAAGALSNEDIANQQPRLACPTCGKSWMNSTHSILSSSVHENACGAQEDSGEASAAYSV